MFCDKFVQADTANYRTFRSSFRLTAPEDFNFGFDVVDAIAENTPDALALLHISNDFTERRFTFRGIKEQSNRTANYLRRLGIRKGDKVLLIMKRSYQYWFTNIALCKLGAVMIPATAQLLPHDISYRCNAAEVTAIICANDSYILNSVEGALPDCPTVKTCLIAGGQRENWVDLDSAVREESCIFPRPTDDQATHNDDPMLIYFTSGTTGFPKMACHNYLYPLGHIATARYWHTNTPGGLHFTISDTGWAKAGWGKIYGQWLCETTIFAYDFDQFNAKKILGLLEKYRITTFCAPPTMYRMLTQEPVKDYDLSSLTHCCSAGEALNPEVFNDWKEQTGLSIYEGFGQTETTCCLGTFPGMEVRQGSMGRPVPGYDVVLLDENGHICSLGSRGEICIRTDIQKPMGLFTGYYKDNAATDKAWHDGYYHTGDMAWMDGKGYYWYVGRGDDIIKSSGYRIGPFEVESALLEHEAVLEAAITGVPDPIRGQVVKATIVLKEGYTPSEELKKELQNHVKKVTAPYKYPRVVEFVKSLPKTASDKIRRVELRK